jgi:xanthine/uracil/vitamin C permease (AzgA family)
MGLIWLLFAVTGLMGWVARVTPNSVIRGIQATLGVLLAVEAFKIMATWWTLGVVSVLIVLVLRQNRYAPAATVLIALGVFIMLVKGQLYQVGFSGITISPPLPVFALRKSGRRSYLPVLPKFPSRLPTPLWQRPPSSKRTGQRSR